jgi:hypothetical protein
MEAACFFAISSNVAVSLLPFIENELSIYILMALLPVFALCTEGMKGRAKAITKAAKARHRAIKMRMCLSFERLCVSFWSDIKKRTLVK